jgi:hypothetical protein
MRSGAGITSMCPAAPTSELYGSIVCKLDVCLTLAFGTGASETPGALGMTPHQKRNFSSAHRALSFLQTVPWKGEPLGASSVEVQFDGVAILPFAIRLGRSIA